MNIMFGIRKSILSLNYIRTDFSLDEIDFKAIN